ncbi:MAG: hypothetical protein HY761_09495 [Candidatus Omnitrophica bacterium]|nr:hypothetical protein [Candidatus Omnitrophota bacterium]
MPHSFDLSKIISLLKKNPLTSEVETLMVDEIEKRGFYKLRCILIPSKYKLDIEYIKTEGDLLYSYQLYTESDIARWDNEPHYPGLKNYPHHYHYGTDVESSELSGKPLEDIRQIFSAISRIVDSI